MVLFKKKHEKEIREKFKEAGTKLLDDSHDIYDKVVDFIEELDEISQVVFVEVFCTKLIIGLDEKYIKEVIKNLCKNDLCNMRKKLIKSEEVVDVK